MNYTDLFISVKKCRPCCYIIQIKCKFNKKIYLFYFYFYTEISGVIGWQKIISKKVKIEGGVND